MKGTQTKVVRPPFLQGDKILNYIYNVYRIKNPINGCGIDHELIMRQLRFSALLAKFNIIK